MKSIGIHGFVARLVKVLLPLTFAIVGIGLLTAARFMLGGPVLSGAESYLTHVSTDKPIYRAGETVFFRGVILSSDNHAPGSEGTASFEIRSPKGGIVGSGNSKSLDSIVGFSWNIPPSQAGGEYTIRISHPLTGDAPAERKFDIRSYRAPRLKSQIVFVRDGYGPGDTVGASVHVDRAEGGIPAGAKVSVVARVDGEDVWKGETIIDSSGNASAHFKLPTSIARGEGSIAMIIQDGGTVETATKTIPILLQTMDLAIYPEGGDLVAGLTNRVYVEGRTPAQKPADMAGVVVNSAGKQVAVFRSEHEGRGRFSFIPLKEETYSIRLTEPAGIQTIFSMPPVKESGVVIATTSDVTAGNKDVVLRAAATADGMYGIALSQRGMVISNKRVELKAQRPAEISLHIPNGLDGVLVATVYDDRNIPVSERLLFRQSEHQLNVRVDADRTDYVPGDKVTLRVSTTDDTGKPVGAVVGLTVTDSSVQEMIDKREQTGQLPVMVLLESDVRNLSDAQVYLDKSNPKSALATDLLLGTQGWRRFAAIQPAKFVAAYSDAARRVLGARMVTDAERARAQMMNNDDDLLKYLTKLALARGGDGVVIHVDGFSGENLPPLTPIAMPVVNTAFTAVGNVATVATVASVGDGVLAQSQLRAVPLKDLLAGDALLDLPDNEDDLLAYLRQLAAAPRGPSLPNANVVAVREYAHTLRPDWTEGTRIDFADTVYWNAGVKTDATTGVATVSFNLSDSVTSFRAIADAFDQNGTLGSGISHIESVKPFSIEPKMPLQITSGDVIQLPIGLVNGMRRELRGADITARGAAGLKFTTQGNNPATLGPRERTRQIVQIDIARDFSGLTSLSFDSRAGAYRDSVSRKLDVQPLGFPYEIATGGVLDSNSSKSFEFTLPGEIVHGSVSSSVTVYPTPLASMTDALQSLLRQPNGCFEQTSSTSYPIVMAEQYFLTHTGVEPAIIEKARNLLDISYKKLIGFESRTKGYEWFGGDPGHEALTAYGLMQFTDMAQVRNVDKDMLDRTRAWLLSRRDGKGSFNLNSKAVDSFGRAPTDTTNAYIVWSLIESGEKGLDREIASVKASAGSSPDSYIVALGANILSSTGDTTGARQLMDKLARSQDSSGRVNGAVTSITLSGGDALAIETTALSALAWMRDPQYSAHAEKSMKWIAEANKGGRFGSTQSTILALRAIVAHDAAHARPKAPGRIVLIVDGKTIGNAIVFTPNTQGTLVLPEFAGELGSGKHTVAIKMEDGSSMPFSISVKFHSTLPDSAEQTQIHMQVALKDRQIQEGSVTEAIVSIVNKSDQPIPTPVAIVGIPGGLEVRHDQLKELVKSGRIDAYEVIGREVVLYWRYLKAKDKFDIPLSLVAAIPGSYTGPASRAYLYYTDEYKSWSPGLQVSITPR